MDNPYNYNELESNAAENLKLFYRRLPTHLLVKDFILGEPKCNYEFYLRDLINKSGTRVPDSASM